MKGAQIKFLSAGSPDELAQLINNHISEGWWFFSENALTHSSNDFWQTHGCWMILDQSSSFIERVKDFFRGVLNG